METDTKLQQSRNHDQQQSPITKSLFNKDFILSTYQGDQRDLTMFAHLRQTPFKKPSPQGRLIKAKTIELPAFEPNGSSSLRQPQRQYLNLTQQQQPRLSGTQALNNGLGADIINKYRGKKIFVIK